MPLEINQEFSLKAPRSLDDRYMKIVNGVSVPYSSTTEALLLIEYDNRYEGLSILVDTLPKAKRYSLLADLQTFEEDTTDIVKDQVPTPGSTNVPESGGVYNAIQEAIQSVEIIYNNDYTY